MTQNTTQAPAGDDSQAECLQSNRIREALDALSAASPVHADLIGSLKVLLTARAELVDSLKLPEFHALIEKDRARFLLGTPLIARGRLPMDPGVLAACNEKLTPVLCDTFPAYADAVQALAGAFKTGKLRLLARAKSFATSGKLPDRRTLDKLGSTSAAAELLLGQIVKAVAETVAHRVCASAELDGWNKGYCPVCGSPPELSYLEGVEGRRRLSCSLCAATWRFTRVACPSCETDKHDQFEYFYAEDRPQERAEACNVCKRYVLAVDRRELSREMVPCVEPLGLVHLDMIMQERGYIPASTESAVTG